jgi:hypothetical protein
MYCGSFAVRRGPVICCEQVDIEECVVCMEPVVDSDTVLSLCSSDPVHPRRCPRSPACRGNDGVCGACEKRLVACVRCRSPLEPRGAYDMPWFACGGMVAAIRVAITILVVSRSNRSSQEL